MPRDCFSPKNVAGLALLSKRKAYGITGQKKSYLLLINDR